MRDIYTHTVYREVHRCCFLRLESPDLITRSCNKNAFSGFLFTAFFLSSQLLLIIQVEILLSSFPTEGTHSVQICVEVWSPRSVEAFDPKIRKVHKLTHQASVKKLSFSASNTSSVWKNQVWPCVYSREDPEKVIYLLCRTNLFVCYSKETTTIDWRLVKL